MVKPVNGRLHICTTVIDLYMHVMELEMKLNVFFTSSACEYEHRIFGPENNGSSLLLTCNQLILLQAKFYQRGRFTVNPRKIPTINFYRDEKSELSD